MQNQSNTTKRSSTILPNGMKLLRYIYHFLFAYLGAVYYGFPSRDIKVIGITGTKGKTSTVEFLNSILETAGYKTAVAGTLRFKVGGKSDRNMKKMTMPGRAFIQRFLRNAVEEKCDVAILELTSEGVKQSRHKFLELDSLIFLNLAPEHIESHGSYENYLKAKLKLVKTLEQSKKKEKFLIVNADDKEAPKFLDFKIQNKFTFSLNNASPFETNESGSILTFLGEKISTKLPGEFNIYNILAAGTLAAKMNIPVSQIKKGVENLKQIRGRAEKVSTKKEFPFEVYVDYAHTLESLEAIYKTFGLSRKICILGNTGGGRDTWKREKMGEMADKYCDRVILTNEDPYDEDPQKIVDDVAMGVKNKPLTIELDRRKAIKLALKEAKGGDKVIITGKGTDPFIMGPNGTKIPWDDARVVREELERLSVEE